MTATVSASLSPFADAAAAVLDAPQPEWLRTLRELSFNRFGQVGVPTSRDEEWRFTPVSRLGTMPLTLRQVPSAFSSETLPAGVRLMSLAEALAEGVPEVEQHLASYAQPDTTPFAALNAATFTDGVVLIIPDGVTIEAPIRITHQSGEAGALYAPRVLIVAGNRSQATIAEYFGAATNTEYFTNACCEIVMGDAARIEHVRIQEESEAAWHVGLTAVRQQRDSHYRSFTLSLGGRVARHDLHALLEGTEAESLMYGLYLPKGDQLIDNHTAIFHMAPHCRSWEVYKGVLADRGRAVFNGKVWVHSEAQKTDAKQTNRNLLLSDQAKVDTKPQLEIFADDVKCTHGATVGKIDPQQRFYLQTRGIGGKTAQSLLLWAFAGEVLAQISSPALRSLVEADVRARLFAMIS